jgi:hypothetical protein
MAERSRELSQFGSFLLVDNSSGNISITTSISPSIGIGTTNPRSKLHVIGDTILDGDVFASGVVTATSFYLDGIGQLVDPTIDKWASAGSDVYRFNGNVGVGTSVISSKFEVLGGTKITGFLTVTDNIQSNQFISTITTGDAPLIVASTTQVNNLNSQYLGGKAAPLSGDIVGTDTSDIILNKSLEDSTTLFFDNIDNTKKFRFNASGISTSTTRVLTVPNISGTVVVTGAPNVITSDMIVDLGIVNNDVAIGASIAYSKLALSNSIQNSDIVNATIQNSKLQNSTISGVGLGSTLSNLSLGSYLSGGSYNGSTQVTVSVAATSSNASGNTIVARDSNGSFTASVITATDFNSTSDINLKTNISEIESPLDLISKLHGVNFEWKTTNTKSCGVIAQELEEILPQLVHESDDGIKSVNYIAIIGILIEALKELRNDIL